MVSPLLLASMMGSSDPTTIVNSVLSAYGLPTLRANDSFIAYDEFEDNFTFDYPRSWVATRDRLRNGVYVSNFQTADKAVVEVFPTPGDGDLVAAAVRKTIVPGERQEDDKLYLPNQGLIKVQQQLIDGMGYTYIQFPSETVTRSGYQIRRKNYGVVAVKSGTAYALVASCRSDQLKGDKEALLMHIVESFRIR